MKILTALAVLALTVHLLSDRALLARALANLRSGVSFALLALVGLSALSMLWAASVPAALGRTVTFCGLFLLLHLFALLDVRFLRLAWATLLASAALTVPVALLFGGADAFSEEGRFAAGGLNPNDYAGLLVVIVLCGMSLAGGPVALRGALAAVAIVAVFLSGSRTAFVALAAAPLLYLALSPRDARLPALRYASVAYVAVLTVLAGGWILDRPQAAAAQARAMTIRDYRNESTWTGRLDIWRGGISMYQQAPVLGVGAGNFAMVAPTVSGMPRRPSASGPGPVAHNAFLGVAAELGTVGLAVFGALLAAAFLRARAAAAASGGVLLGLIACVLVSLSLSWEYAKVLYVVMGSALALTRASPAPAPPA